MPHPRATPSEPDLPPPFNAVALGRAIAAARHEAGLTLDELAARSGVSRRMIISIEQGTKSSSIRLLHALSHALRVPIGALAEAACGHRL